MSVAILADTNSGIGPEEAEKIGVYIMPMPFYINDELFYEGKTLRRRIFIKSRLREPGLPHPCLQSAMSWISGMSS